MGRTGLDYLDTGVGLRTGHARSVRGMTATAYRAAIAAIAARVADLGPGRRILAIAGPPGAGKSTLAEALVAALPNAAAFPMDGFHYDDALLEARGLRPRKGAPETFDVGGFAHMLDRLRRNDEAEVVVPVFDRDLEISRGSARPIRRDTDVIVAEGNWLLLDEEPWRALRPRFDLTLLLDVPMAELERRLTARWTGYGLDRAALTAKLEGNDLPNARRAVDRTGTADLVLQPDGTLTTGNGAGA